MRPRRLWLFALLITLSLGVGISGVGTSATASPAHRDLRPAPAYPATPTPIGGSGPATSTPRAQPAVEESVPKAAPACAAETDRVRKLTRKLSGKHKQTVHAKRQYLAAKRKLRQAHTTAERQRARIAVRSAARRLTKAKRVERRTSRQLKVAKRNLKSCMNATGTIRIDVIGVPEGHVADINVTGPGFEKHLNAAAELGPVTAGRYEVTTQPIDLTDAALWPRLDSHVIVVDPGSTTSVTVDYAITVPDTTTIVPPTDVTAADPTADGGTTLSLSEPTSAAPGDTLAIGVGPATPYGALGRVTNVAPDRESVTIDPSAASLTDAVETGDIDIAIPLGGEDVARAGRPIRPLIIANGNARETAPAQRPVLEQLRKNLSCKHAESAELSANFEVTPTLSVRASWNLFRGVTSAEVRAQIDQTASVELHLNADGSCTLKKTALLAKPITFRTIQFSVGPIPVVIVPKLQFYADGDASFQASALAGLHQDFNATAGIRYQDSKFTPFSDFSHSVSPIGPSFAGEAEADAGITPELNFAFYNVGGPTIGVRASVHAAAKAVADPTQALLDWSIDLGLSGAASLDADLLRLHSGRLTLLERTFRVADGQMSYVPTGPVITTNSLPAGRVGQAYSHTLGTKDGREGSWTVQTGALPPGLTLSDTGTIAGTPTSAGNYAFTIAFTDRRAAVATKDLAIAVEAPLKCINWINQDKPISIGHGGYIYFDFTGVAGDYGLSSYSGTITWGEGSPSNFGLSSGVVKHTYNTPGTFSIRLTAKGVRTDGSKCQDAATYTAKVS